LRLAEARKPALELNTWSKTGIDPRTQAPGQQRKQVQNSRRPFIDLREARWSEVDSEDRQSIIAAERMKTRLRHAGRPPERLRKRHQ
jgi:hypothetical protein